MKKFIFSKFAGLQAYSWQLSYQMNSFTGIFWQHFKPPMLSPCIDLSPPSNFEEPPPMFSRPVGNPVYRATDLDHWPNTGNHVGKVCSQMFYLHMWLISRLWNTFSLILTHGFLNSNVSEIWPTETASDSHKTGVTKTIISQELKDISSSCKKHWKAYLILL